MSLQMRQFLCFMMLVVLLAIWFEHPCLMAQQATLRPASDRAESAVRSDQGSQANRRADLHLNVRDFGARGDGQTNDRDAFVAAINALPARGGSLFIPASDSDYVWRGSGIVIEKPVNIIGAVSAASRVRFEGQGATLEFRDVASGGVERVSFFRGQNAGDGPCLVLEKVRDVVVSKIHIQGFVHGIVARGNGTMHVAIENSRVIGVVSDAVAGWPRNSVGIYVEPPGPTSVRINNVYCQHFETLVRSGGDGTMLSGNVFEAASYGIQVDTGTLASFGDWFDPGREDSPKNRMRAAWVIKPPVSSVGIFHPRGIMPKHISMDGVPRKRVVGMLESSGR